MNQVVTLRPFQKKGVEIMHSFNGRVLLADDMGAGKTVEALTYLYETKSFPAVVVTMKSLKLQWQDEAWRHFCLRAKVLSGIKPNPVEAVFLRKEKLIIINYDILREWLPWLYWLPPKCIIGDEIHTIGNMGTRRCRYFTQLCGKCEKVIAITGTPIQNSCWELFPILNILAPEEFPDAFIYGNRYCQAEKGFGRWKFTGSKSSTSAELHSRLVKTCMIRRTFAEFAPEMPRVLWTVTPMEISDRREYDEASQNVIAWLAKTSVARAIRAAKARRYSEFSYLKRLAAELKIASVIEWIDEWIKANPGKKLLVGTLHHVITDRLHRRFEKISTFIDGNTSEAERRDRQNLYRNSSTINILFGQIATAGTGLNLPETTGVALVELPWNPALCRQFIMRAQRITTTHPVYAYFLVGLDTIEHKVCSIIQRKQEMMDRVIDGVAQTNDSLSLFDELEKMLLEKQQ